jgi:hypothetical protein
MSLVYSRPWFRDHVNYQKQQPIQISGSEFERIPHDSQHLFEWLRRE